MAKKNGEGKVKRERSEVAKATTALNAAIVHRDKLRKQVEDVQLRSSRLTLSLEGADAAVAEARARYEELTK